MNKWIWSTGFCFALASTTLTAAYAQQIGLDEGWSIGGQALTRGESADFTRNFYAGTTYIIYADGSTNVRDLDMQIIDSSGRVVASDTRSAKEAAVEFSPRYSGRYTIRLRMASASGRALGYFIVFTVGEGWNVPRENVEAAFARLVGVTSVAQLANFQIDRFYGFVLRPGEVQSITLTGISGGRLAAVAVGDDFADDLDLAVYQNGSCISIDTAIDAMPITVFNARPGSLELRVAYESGSGPSLVLMGLLERKAAAASGRFHRL